MELKEPEMGRFSDMAGTCPCAGAREAGTGSGIGASLCCSK